MDFIMNMVLFVLCISVGALFAYILSVFIHEGAHIMSSVLCGFRFSSLICGPLLIERKNGKLQFGLEKNSKLWGGGSAALPKAESPRNIDIFCFSLIAGPCANGIVGVITLIVTLIKARQINMHTNKADMLVNFGLLFLLFIFSGYNLINFLLATIPQKKGAFTGANGNDLMRFISLRRNNVQGEEDRQILRLSFHQVIYGNCKDIDLSSTIALSESSDLCRAFYGMFFCYNYYADNCNNQKADLMLAKLREQFSHLPSTFIDAQSDDVIKLLNKIV